MQAGDKAYLSLEEGGRRVVRVTGFRGAGQATVRYLDAQGQLTELTVPTDQLEPIDAPGPAPETNDHVTREALIAEQRAAHRAEQEAREARTRAEEEERTIAAQAAVQAARQARRKQILDALTPEERAELEAEVRAELEAEAIERRRADAKRALREELTGG